MTRRAAPGIAILGVLGLVLAAPALAAPAWLAPIDLSAAGRNATEPQVAVDPAGNAVALWSRSNGSHTIIQTASRQAGGAWLAPIDLSAAGRNATEPQVAVDPAGNAVALWSRSNGSHTIIQSARRPAGGAWTAAVDLSMAGRNAKEPQVAVDPAGNAVAVWSRYDGFDFIVQGSSKPAAGAWTAPLDLSVAGRDAEEPQVAVDLGGNAVAVWSRHDGTNLIVQSVTRPAGGAWSSSADLSPASRSADQPQIAVDPAGNATAVWARSDAGPLTVIQGATRPAGGAWGPPVDLSAANQTVAPQVAMDAAGNAVAVWARSAASPTVIESTTKPVGGAWSAPLNLSVIGNSAVEPQVALDPGGDGVAVWSRDNGVNTIVQGAGHDAEGPLVRSLSVPSAGTVKQPVAFSVSLFDVWSAIGLIGWSFGDGAAAHGAAVQHTFARPGAYQVTVVVGDALANTSSAAGTIAIFRKASAFRDVRVRRGRALLRLRCPSPAGCTGALRLVASFKAKRGRRLVGKRLSIGRARFGIPGARTTTVPVRLTRKGRALVRGASRRGLRTQLTGPGVRHRLLLLLRPRRPSQKRR